MAKSTSQEHDLTDAMLEALNELGREVDKDHICDQCLNKMKSSLGYVGGLRIVLYECPSCEHMAVKEFIG